MRRAGTGAAALVLAVLGAGSATGACTGSSPSADARLSVTPAASRSDEAVALRLQGVESGTAVTVSVTSTDREPVVFSARGSFTVSDGGVLTPAAPTPSPTTPAATVGPSGGDATLLISAMQPPAGSSGETGGGYVWPADGGTFTWTVQDQDGQTLATAATQRRFVASGTRQVELSQAKDGIVGGYAAVPDGARHPAALVLGGSEGGSGTATRQAEALAARGIPALGQAYYKATGLPDTLSRLPLEAFDKGLDWLRAQPEVDPARIWVIGGSYGSQAALLEASRRPDLVHGVIATSPSNSVTGSYPANGTSPWTVGGEDLPFTVEFGNPDPGDNPAAVIQVEKVAGPVLAVCGEADTLWGSCAYARAIMSRLDAKGFAHPHEVYAYPQAGHLVDTLLPYLPRRADLFADGVSPQADELARIDVWPKVVQAITTS